jgi:hypothetical protein
MYGEAMCREPGSFWIIPALGVLLGALPSAATAQTSGEAVYAGSPSSVALGVNVTASVSASCSFTTGAVPNGTYSVGNVMNSYSIEVTFRLRCNSPSRVGIVSNNGGMLAESVPSVPAGYARLAPYRVTLRLAGNAGASEVSSCESLTLISHGSCEFRGPAGPTNGLRLPGPASDTVGSFIRISSDGYSAAPILIASNSYADRLTVTISPAF